MIAAITQSQTIVQRAGKRKRRSTFAAVRDQSFFEQYGVRQATNVGADESGISVDAVVGPRSGAYMGSAPDQDILRATIEALNQQLPTANNWIRGHLLNDWLGGPGTDNDNLAPMSHTTNQSWNANFEQKMKQITERLYGFYNLNAYTDWFLLIGYTATASGTYAPAHALGFDIPNQFDGNWYYGAFDRVAGTVHYDNASVGTAWGELDNAATQTIGALENAITPTTMQVH